MTRALVVALLVVAACGGVPTRAKEAYERGDYLAAAELYDVLVRAEPDDSDAREMRSEARRRALFTLLGKARGARRSGRVDVSLDSLTTALEHRRRWKETEDQETRAMFDTELAAASTELRSRVAAAVKVGRPLRAEAILRQREALLDDKELAALKKELHRSVGEAGERECKRLSSKTGADAPYLTVLVGRYCLHFRADPPPAFALPDLRAAPAFEGSVAGATGPQMEELKKQLSASFAQTIWHSPSATTPIRVALSGLVAVTFAKARVSREVPWIERVAYTVTETRQVPHTVPYTTTESYTESVPTTSSESYSYSCGTGRMCTGSRPVTRYTSQMRTRAVTRHRTEYRTESHLVTRYRDEPRVFRFQADEHTGSYQAELQLLVDLRLPSPKAIALDKKDERRGLEHNVSFPPAKVAPSKPNLPLAEEWFEAQVAALSKEMRERLEQDWIDRFCVPSIYLPEEAARCAYAGKALPRAGVRGLAKLLGDDAALVVDALARPSLSL